MEIMKSTRHQKIIGNFGEALLCNWLSRSGFEVTIVDHTWIDVLAYNSQTRKRLGISVKSRTRVKGTENTSVNILSYQKGKNDRQKVINACKAFAAEPWIAIYVESSKCADLFLLRDYGGARPHPTKLTRRRLAAPFYIELDSICPQ